MTAHSTDADSIQAQAVVDKSATALVTKEVAEQNEEITADNKASEEAADNRHGAATTARQWQVLSQLPVSYTHLTLPTTERV